MSNSSWMFLAMLLVVALLFTGGRRWRQCVLMVANGAFLSSFHLNRPTWVALSAFILGTWCVLEIARWKPSSSVVLCGVLGGVCSLLVFRRYWPMDLFLRMDSPLSVVNVVGLSYMLFKFIHVLVDQVQGQLARRTFLSYVNYQLAFFTLAAGPVNPYNDFQAAWDAPEACRYTLREGVVLWRRVFSGVIKMAVVAPCLGLVISRSADWLGPDSASSAYVRLVVSFYLLPLQLYFNFAGYSDIAIAGAGLLGFRLPENFNRPFSARNVMEFWDRWHMSLTRWLRDYFFMSSYRYVATHWRVHLRSLGYILLGLTMLLVGLWHGTERRYLYFGLINGLAVIIVKAWGDALGSRLGRVRYQRYLGNPWVRRVGVVLTFHFMCGALLLFSMNASAVWSLIETFLREAGMATAALAPRSLVLPAFRAAAVPVGASLAVVLYSEYQPRRSLAGRAGWAYLGMVFQAMVLSAFFIGQTVLDTPDPVVIYQKF